MFKAHLEFLLVVAIWQMCCCCCCRFSCSALHRNWLDLILIASVDDLGLYVCELLITSIDHFNNAQENSLHFSRIRPVLIWILWCFCFAKAEIRKQPLTKMEIDFKIDAKKLMKTVSIVIQNQVFDLVFAHKLHKIPQ